MEHLFTEEYDAAMFIDDGIRRLVWTMGQKQVELSPEDFLNTLQEDYEINLVFGSHVSSFEYYRGPLYINRFNPFDINNVKRGGTIWGGATMMLDRGYRFDEELKFAEDVDICYMNLYRYGIVWNDIRIGFVPLIPMHSPGSGGVTQFRTAEAITEVRNRLRQKYGSWVRIDRAI